MGGRSYGCRLVVAAALLASVTGCDPYPTGPRVNGDLAAALLAESLEADASGVATGPIEHACPAGGRIVSDGETQLIEDGEYTVYEWRRTVQYDGCTFQLAGTVSWTDGALEFK